MSAVDTPVPAAAAPGGGEPARPAPGGRPRRPRRLRRPAAAVGVGLLLYLAFPPVGWWPLAPVAVAALAVLVRDRRLRTSYALGGLAGLAFLLPLLVWSKVAGLDGWLILTAAQAAILALVAPAVTLTARLPGWPLWVAASWVGQEALRGRWPFGGFPWGRLAFSQPDTPFTRLAALGGAPLVTAGVALTGGLLAAAAVAPRVRPAPPHRRRAALLATGALAVPLGGLAVPLPSAPQAGEVVVAAVQGNVPRRGLAALGQKRAVLRNHLARTEELAAAVRAGRTPAPDLVLWPENSSDLDPFGDAEAADLLTRAARAVDRPILVGAVLSGPGRGHVRNAGLVWGPAGYLGPMYVKRHPVPFAEYLPGRAVLARVVTRFAHEMPNDFLPGDRPGVLPLAGRPVGDVICFEVAYDGLVRDTIRGGARLLVVQTNNATFGRLGESEQQLAMSRLRAVEHGRATVQVSTSGHSALIRPDGAVTDRSGLYRPAVLVRRLPLRTSRTVADRVGVAPEAALAAAGLLATVAGVRRRRGRRGEG